jgi:hypothetical protein
VVGGSGVLVIHGEAGTAWRHTAPWASIARRETLRQGARELNGGPHEGDAIAAGPRQPGWRPFCTGAARRAALVQLSTLLEADPNS